MACLQGDISSVRKGKKKKIEQLELPQTQEYSECGNI